VGAARGQWVQTNGPFGGRVSCFAVMGTMLFAGTNGGGVYRSTDGGASWMQVNHGLTEPYIETFAVSGSKLFVGTTYFTGVFLSTDSGATWATVNSGMHGSRVEALAISDSHMFAGTAYYGGLFHSTNGGTSWTQVDSNLFDSDIRALAFASVAAQKDGKTLFAATGNGVNVSTDCGETWRQANSGLLGAVSVFAVDETGGTNVFAGTWRGGVFRTTNDGATWAAVNAGLPTFSLDTTEYYTVSTLALNGQTLFAGTLGRGIYRSTDNGESWSEVNNGLTDSTVQALLVAGSNVLAGTDVGGVFLSTDNGASWAQTNSGLHQVPITDLAVSGGTLFAGAFRGGVFRSTDIGTSWIQVNSGLASPGVNAIIVTPVTGQQTDATVFAGTYYGLFRSTNSGMAWTRADSGLPSLSIGALAVSAEAGCTNIYAGTSSGAFRSTDNGSSWKDISPVLNVAVTAFAVNNANLFAGTVKGRVYLSTNCGNSWSDSYSGLSAPNGIEALVAYDTVLFTGTSGCTQRSTNNGASWEEGSYDAYDFQDFAVCGTTIFAGSWNSSVFFSTNNGILWRDARTGLKKTQVNALAVLGSNLFAGTTAYGVWRRPIAEMITSVEPNPRELPTEFCLVQNYPNPFNPKTVVSCRLPVASWVRLGVYDVLGREVAVLLDEHKAPGLHQVEFDGTKLSSGIYICRMTAGDYVESKRMLLMK